ncbi:MAG TPA: hypothetical protein DD618_01290 [Acholeplasmatales bacterium]|nr:hypothetical protein [Acholeplasmatales bacterium]
MIKDLYVELSLYQERMHQKSKEKFRNYLQTKAIQHQLGYQIIPQHRFSKNVVIGNLETAEYILGAHYDTPPRMPSFLMKSVLFFNILMPILFCALFVGSILLSIHLLIPIAIVIYFFLYSEGFLAIANKFNFNDNTSGVLTLLYLMGKLKSSKVAYVFFDNEEKGLVGSISLIKYLQKHKLDFRRRKFIIFDCVGVGNTFGFDHFRKPGLSNELEALFNKLQFKDYDCVVRKGSAFELSDHAVFARYSHVGVFAFSKNAKGKLIIKNVHSHKDKEIVLENILVISKTIEEYIMQGGLNGKSNIQKA